MDATILSTLKTIITRLLVASLFTLPVACTEPNIMEGDEPTIDPTARLPGSKLRILRVCVGRQLGWRCLAQG